MKNNIWIGLLIAALSPQNYATEASYGMFVPHTFSNGTIASAEQINANFQAIVERLEVLDENKRGGNLIIDMNRDSSNTVGPNLGASWNDNLLIGQDILETLYQAKGNVIFGSHVGMNGYDPGNNIYRYNVVVGDAAMYLSTGGGFNVAIGSEALAGWSKLTDQTGDVQHNRNVAVGSAALFNYVGDENTAVGNYALHTTTSSASNTAVGAYALEKADAAGNTAVGWSAARSGTSSERNTAVGVSALESSNGNRNTSVGWSASPHRVSGNFNVAVGYQAGIYNQTGDSNTSLGYSAGGASSSDSALTNTLALGFQARVEAPNEAQIGNNNIVNVYFGRRGGDTSSTTNANIVTEGVVYADTVVLDTEPVIGSDEKTKADIQDLGLGLEFIESLRPVSYRRIASPERLDMGLIAQELETELAKQGQADNGAIHHGEDSLAIRYTTLTAPMIKAIQELSAANSEQKQLIQDLQARLDTQSQHLASLLARQEILVAESGSLTQPQLVSR